MLPCDAVLLFSSGPVVPIGGAARIGLDESCPRHSTRQPEGSPSAGCLYVQLVWQGKQCQARKPKVTG